MGTKAKSLTHHDCLLGLSCNVSKVLLVCSLLSVCTWMIRTLI